MRRMTMMTMMRRKGIWVVVRTLAKRMTKMKTWMKTKMKALRRRRRRRMRTMATTTKSHLKLTSRLKMLTLMATRATMGMRMSLMTSLIPNQRSQSAQSKKDSVGALRMMCQTMTTTMMMMMMMTIWTERDARRRSRRSPCQMTSRPTLQRRSLIPPQTLNVSC